MSSNTPPSVMIATPMYGGMCTGQYVLGLLNTIVALRGRGNSVCWAQVSNESLITRARNELVRLFLNTDSEYLMFVDADIAFDATAIATLLDANKDIVCGVYPKKEVDWEQINKVAKEGKDNLQDFAGAFVLNTLSAPTETDASGCVEIRHGGTGFMLIKRSVFEILSPYVPSYRVSTVKDSDTDEYSKPLVQEFFATSIDSTGTLLSEDFHFCDLWRAHGGKIHANPFISLGHVGTYVYGGDILKAGGNLK